MSLDAKCFWLCGRLSPTNQLIPHPIRYVDVSTVDDETAKAISDAVRKTGAEFLEVNYR